MKYSIAAAVVLACAVSAAPAAQSDPVNPVRVLPSCWEFDIVKHEGPGCPNDSNWIHTTRPTYGSNTVDGTEIYFWYFAYPHIYAQVEANKEKSVWCETTLKYTEKADCTGNETASNYRLRLNKAGTSMQATYRLEDGVSASWKFTYYPEDRDEVIDEIAVKGPIYQSTSRTDNSPIPPKKDLWSLPECGSGIIKFKTELLVRSESDRSGLVNSEFATNQGTPEYYGVQQGISYDFEKCQK